MSTYDSLFLSHFNPCPNRVESIEKLLLDQCDDSTKLDLLDHIEQCRRCKKYYIYLEAVDNGFKDYLLETSKKSPLDHSELPSALKTEMAQAMKRNLAKWLFEAARSAMYRQGLTVKYLLDYRELQPLEVAILRSRRLINSLFDVDILCSDDQKLFSYLYDILNNSCLLSGLIDIDDIINFLRISISTDEYFFLPYLFLDQVYKLSNQHLLSIDVNKDALNRNPSSDWSSYFYNNIGCTHHRQMQLDNAKYYYQISLDNRDDIIFHLNIGVLYLELNHTGYSYKHFLRVYDNFKFNNFISIKRNNTNTIFNFLNYYYIKYSNTIMSDNRLSNLFNHIRGYLK